MATVKKIEKDVILDRIVGSAIILRPSTKFAQFILNIQLNLMQLLTPQQRAKLSLEKIQQDIRVYVVTDNDNVEAAADLIKNRRQDIFEDFLSDWCPNKTLWPKNRSLQAFAEHFEIQYFQDPFVLPQNKETPNVEISFQKTTHSMKKMCGSYVIIYPNNEFVQQSGHQPSANRLIPAFIPIFIPDATTPEEAAKYLAENYQLIFTEELLLAQESYDQWKAHLDYLTFLKVFNKIYCDSIYSLEPKAA